MSIKIIDPNKRIKNKTSESHNPQFSSQRKIELYIFQAKKSANGPLPTPSSEKQFYFAHYNGL